MLEVGGRAFFSPFQQLGLVWHAGQSQEWEHSKMVLNGAYKRDYKTICLLWVPQNSFSSPATMWEDKLQVNHTLQQHYYIRKQGVGN